MDSSSRRCHLGAMAMALPPGEPEAAPWRVAPFTELADLVLRPPGGSPGRPWIVAVDGRGASGKSTLAARFAAVSPTVALVHTDDIAWHHSFFGWADLMADGVLAPARRGEEVRFRPPAWDERDRPGGISVPAGTTLVVVEGVGAGRRELMPLLDAVVWVQSDFAAAERRGIARDIAGGDNGTAEETIAFWHEWMDQELPFQADQRPWERADAVVAGTPTQDHGPDDVEIGTAARPR